MNQCPISDQPRSAASINSLISLLKEIGVLLQYEHLIGALVHIKTCFTVRTLMEREPGSEHYKLTGGKNNCKNKKL